MKILILGKVGCGKTTLIKQGFLPKLNKFYIIDFVGGYEKLGALFHVLSLSNVGISAQRRLIKECFEKIDKETYLIIDDTQLCSFKYLGIENYLMDRNVIMVYQSVQAVKNDMLTDYFDEIYCFGTTDPWLDDFYLNHYRSMGKTVYIWENINPSSLIENNIKLLS